MRLCLLAVFATACSNPWYAVSRQSLAELSQYRLSERDDVGLRAERVTNDARVVLRASDLVERRDTDAPEHLFVRVRRPLIAPGIVTLAFGVTAILVGGYLTGLSGPQGQQFSAGLISGVVLIGTGGGLAITGITLIAVGANGRGQTFQPGRFAVELGRWPIPHAPVENPD